MAGPISLSGPSTHSSRLAACHDHPAIRQEESQ
jgi:hypothetical protein